MQNSLPFFGGLPSRGVWNSVGLTRGQFLAVVVLSVLAFVFIGGPVWRHPSGSHFWRIGLSYAVIVPLAALALWRNHAMSWANVAGASAVVGFIKLVATALLLVLIGMAR